MKSRRMQFIQTVQKILSRYESTCILVLLGTLAITLHHSSLNGYWRFDDGAHLKFAATYAPWQYFFQPSITVLQSYANVAPYNVFFYDINLAFFGMVPRWHYAHQIALLAATSFATYQLIKLWQPPLTALLAAVLFLAGLPTLYVAQQLMTGHYATGLLFTVLSLYCFTQGVRGNRYNLVLWGAFFYLLATTCKELYVPLVLILPFIPAGNFKTRVKALLPYVAVASFYTVWRFSVLGHFHGGYIAVELGPLEQLRQLASIPMLLSGWTNEQTIASFIRRFNGANVLAAALVVVLGALAIYRKRLSWVLVFAALPLLVLPLVPLTRNPGLTSADRYLFVLWWACAVLLAIIVGSLKNYGSERILKYACVACLTGLTVYAQHSEHERIARLLDMQETLYKAALLTDNNTALITPDHSYYKGVLSDARHAAMLIGDSSIGPAKIVVDGVSFCSYAEAGNKILEYEESCNCMKDVTFRINESLAKINSSTVDAVPGVPLMVALSFRDRILYWELGPHVDGVYSAIIDGTPFRVSSKGNVTYASLVPLRFKIRHQGSDGRVAISPMLEFDRKEQSSFTWTGHSVALAPGCGTSSK